MLALSTDDTISTTLRWVSPVFSSRLDAITTPSHRAELPRGTMPSNDVATASNEVAGWAATRAPSPVVTSPSSEIGPTPGVSAVRSSFDSCTVALPTDSALSRTTTTLDGRPAAARGSAVAVAGVPLTSSCAAEASPLPVYM